MMMSSFKNVGIILLDQGKDSIQNFRGKHHGFFRNARKKPELRACVLDLLLLWWLKFKIKFFHTIIVGFLFPSFD